MLNFKVVYSEKPLKFLKLIRIIKIEEIYSEFKEFELISKDDFILSPYFQIPLYDILKDDFCEFYGYYYENKLSGISALRIEEDYFMFPTYEGVNPYQDFIVDNRFRKDFIVNVLKGKKFILFPILEDSPTVKILSENFNIKKEVFSEIYYLELPKMLEELIYKSKRRDDLVKILKKSAKHHNFELVNNFDFYEVLIKAKLYLLPQKLQLFISDLISICKTNGFLRIFSIDKEFYFITFVYKSRAYIWHYEANEEVRNLGFLKILESLILENVKLVYIFTDIPNLGFHVKTKKAYKIYSV